MINRMYKRSRRFASKVKRRLIPSQAGTVYIVPYQKPAVRPEVIRQRGAAFRAAVIGAGNQGRDICLGLQQLEGVEIAAVADRSGDALSRLQTEVGLSGAHFYQDASELFQAEKPDFVCVATNTPSHVPLARMAIEAGAKYLLVEKPIGTCPHAARELIALAESNSVRMAVNHSRRWSLDYQAIRRYLEAGQIGTVRQVYVAYGSGGLAMIGVHYIDLMRFLINSDIAAVTGHLDPETAPNKRGAEYCDPGGHALFHFANGARGFLDCSNDLPRKDSFLVIKTEHGRIEVDERARQWTVISQEKHFTVPFVDSKTLAGKVARVAAELLSGDTPRSGGPDGVAALDAVIAAHLSHQQQHQPVPLPLTPEQQMTDIHFP